MLMVELELMSQHVFDDIDPMPVREKHERRRAAGMSDIKQIENDLKDYVATLELLKSKGKGAFQWTVATG